MASLRLPNTLKEWLASIASGVAVLGAVGALYLHMHTDLEAQEVKKQLEQTIVQVQERQNKVNEALRESLDRSEILRLRREVKRLQNEKLKPGITMVELGNIDSDIKYYEKVIACIQAQNKHCL